jgi:hypothetical protein
VRDVKSDLKGDGFLLGGVVLFGQDGTVLYRHQEENPGDAAPLGPLREALEAYVRVKPAAGTATEATEATETVSVAE